MNQGPQIAMLVEATGNDGGDTVARYLRALPGESLEALGLMTEVITEAAGVIEDAVYEPWMFNDLYAKLDVQLAAAGEARLRSSDFGIDNVDVSVHCIVAPRSSEVPGTALISAVADDLADRDQYDNDAHRLRFGLLEVAREKAIADGSYNELASTDFIVVENTVRVRLTDAHNYSREQLALRRVAAALEVKGTTAPTFDFEGFDPPRVRRWQDSGRWQG